MRLQEKLYEEMEQKEVDRILLNSATNDVFRAAQRSIDNYIGNITIERKDIKAKKKFAFDVILRNLVKRKKDIY